MKNKKLDEWYRSIRTAERIARHEARVTQRKKEKIWDTLTHGIPNDKNKVWIDSVEFTQALGRAFGKGRTIRK